MSKKLKNPNQSKNAKGQFQKVIPDSPVAMPEDPVAFINEVKAEIINGYWYPERASRAYQLISGSNQPANNLLLRRTILNYVNDGRGL